MLSKCFNSHCSAKFHYLGQGKLFRVDFSDVRKKKAGSLTSESAGPERSKTYPIEHFWLCEKCAASMSVTLNDMGQVGLVHIGKSAPVLLAPARKLRQAAAS